MTGEEEKNDTGLGYWDAKIQKEGLTDKPATKRTKKASMSNRVQRKSVFRKRLGRGGGGGGWRVGWLLGLHFTPRTSRHLPEFSSRVLFVQAVTLREGIGN